MLLTVSAKLQYLSIAMPHSKCCKGYSFIQKGQLSYMILHNYMFI